MSTSEGALGAPPQVVQGSVVPATVVSASAIIDPLVKPAHAFFDVVRELVHRIGYHNEADLSAALDVVDTFEKRYLRENHQHVVSDDNLAAREDVTQRVPPRGGTYNPPVNIPQIDYAQLAQAILAAQKQAERDSLPE